MGLRMSSPPPIATINMRGKKKYRNNLKIELEGANALIWKSSTNQSNEKKVSFAEPTLFV